MAKNAAKEAASERFVSATELAQRIDVSRPYINKLESEGVLRRTPRGFPLDASVIDYIHHLRRERPPSPRAAADAELATAKARWLDLRVKEKERELVPASIFDAVIDYSCGVVLTELHGLAARLFPLDLHERRRADAIILDVRRRIAEKVLQGAEAYEAEIAAAVQAAE